MNDDEDVDDMNMMFEGKYEKQCIWIWHGITTFGGSVLGGWVSE